MSKLSFCISMILLVFSGCTTISHKIDSRDIYSLYKQKSHLQKVKSIPVFNWDGQNVSIKCTNLPISNLINQITDHYQLTLSYKGQLYGTISLNVKQMNYAEALKLILAAGNYTGKLEKKRLDVSFAAVEGSIIKEIQLNYLNAQKLSIALKASYEGEYKFTVIPEHNAIIISGDGAAVGKLEQTIGLLDKPAPSILLEIILLEINKSDFEEYGISLSDLANKRLFLSQANAPDQINSNNISGLELKDTGSMDLPADFIFKMNIKALKKKGLAKVITHPHVVSRSGEQAIVEVSIDNYLYIQKPSQMGTGYVFDTEKVSAGVTLKMTPVLTNSGTILINFHAEESNVLPPENNANFVVDRNTLDSTLRAKDGDVMVAGGLVQKYQSKSHSGIPFLSKIPIINLFFNRQFRESNSKEIVFFILPKIFHHDYNFENNFTQSENSQKNKIK